MSNTDRNSSVPEKLYHGKTTIQHANSLLHNIGQYTNSKLRNLIMRTGTRAIMHYTNSHIRIHSA